MPQLHHDQRLQECYDQLNTIVARRNELLRELYRMIESRKDIQSTSDDLDQEDDNFQRFLKRFDLSTDADHGSISNLKEDEIPFISETLSKSPPSALTSVADNKTSKSTRTTRSQSRATEQAKSPSPILDKSFNDAPPEVQPLHISDKDDDVQPQSSTVLSPTGSSGNDDDELDFIGSSALHAEGDRRSSLPVSVDAKQEGNPQPSSPVLQAQSEGSTTTLLLSPPASSNVLMPIPAPEDVDMKLLSVPTTPKLSADELETPAPADMDMPSPSVGAEPPSAEGDDTRASQEPHQSTNVEPDVTLDSIPMDVDNHSEKDEEEKVEVAQKEDDKREEDIEKESEVHDLLEGRSVAIKQEPPSSTSPTKRIHIHIPLPPSIEEEILIPAPTSATNEETTFVLDGIASPVVRPESPKPPASKVDSHDQSIEEYTLPPLSIMPAEFSNRKTKSTKRKREREGKRDKDKDKDKDKEDMAPLGLNRWGATVVANPVWKRVARANKCLSTREWGVAMNELRLIRTIERIESLKDSGKWSFRQPKKQRGVGGLVKTHWDYLLDEMKWMRIDFREERRWKMALAYNLSTAVLEWHFAKTSEERQRTGICVKWQTSRFRANTGNSSRAMSVDDVQQEPTNTKMLDIDYDSEDDSEDEREKTFSVTDALEPANVIQESMELDIQPKNEEVDDQSAIAILHQVSDSDLSQETRSALTGSANPNNALKFSSSDPILGGSKSSSQSTNGDAEAPIASAKPSKSDLAPLQEQIAYYGDDRLFIDLDNIRIHDTTKGKGEVFEPTDLPSLFPDLQPLGLLDVALPVGPTDGKKKVDKKSDRDDPNKRIEDVTYTKLYPTGRFMFTKPTLIGPLQPAKKWKDGKWLPLDNASVVSETENGARIPDESASDLFDGRPSISSQHSMPKTQRIKDGEDKEKHIWTASDDALLKTVIDKYSTNWQLIADSFNATRLSTPTDVRTPLDCAERWKEKWNPDRKLQLPEASQALTEEASTSGTNAQSNMLTRAVKRLASTGAANSPSSATSAASTEARKRRRHILLNEAVRKAVKKRTEAAQKTVANQRKTPAVHETHNQFNKLPKLSPQELSRMKAERDQRDSQEAALARKRQEEQQRQNLLLREQRPNATVQQQPQQPQQQTPQPQPLAPAQPLQQQAQFPPQLAQLQQLQAQQQVNQNQRPNMPGIAVMPNRPARITANANGRPVGPQALQAQAQAQLLQARMQVPVLQGGGPSNLPQGLLPQNQGVGTALHPSTGAFYGLPQNLTQEQFLILAIQTAQQQQAQQQQQNQPAQSNFGAQP